MPLSVSTRADASGPRSSEGVDRSSEPHAEAISAIARSTAKWRHQGTPIATREKRRLFAKSKERSGLQYRTRHAIVHFTEEGQPETGKPGGNSRWTSQGNLRQPRGNPRRLDEIRHRSGNGSHPATGHAERWRSRAQGLRSHSRLRSGVSDGKCEPRFVLIAQLAEQPKRRPKGRRDGGRAGGRKTVKAGIENTPRGLRLPWGFSRLEPDSDRPGWQQCGRGSSLGQRPATMPVWHGRKTH
jgi:hypothetical protein